MVKKRRHDLDVNPTVTKKQRLNDGGHHRRGVDLTAKLGITRHHLLSGYYKTVSTLRAFLLASLPVSSRVRRRRLMLHGRDQESCLLDTCLVGVLKEPSPSTKQDRKLDFQSFTQSQQCGTGAMSARLSRVSMSEVRYQLPPSCAKNIS